MDHGYFDVADGLRSTFIHFGDLLGTLLPQPAGQLGDADDNRVVLLTYFHGIADVIAVAMGAEQDVDLLHVLLRIRTHWIIHDPRIDNHCFTRRRFNTEGCVA